MRKATEIKNAFTINKLVEYDSVVDVTVGSLSILGNIRPEDFFRRYINILTKWKLSDYCLKHIKIMILLKNLNCSYKAIC